MKIVFLFVMVITISYGCKKGITTPDQIISTDYDIMIDGKIDPSTGFGMGVDDENSLRNWIHQDSTDMGLFYPGNLTWGAVFITVHGDPTDSDRHWIDISACDSISIEMKGDIDGTMVKIGMKDKDDPSDGLESKQPVRLSTQWTTYGYPLSVFKTCDLTKVYVVTEFVFPGGTSNSAANVYVKNIRFLK